MTHEEIKLGMPVMTSLGKGVVKRISQEPMPYFVHLESISRQLKAGRWFDLSDLSTTPPPPEQSTATPLFTPTGRRDRVWELAARLYLVTLEDDAGLHIKMAEKLMVEFEATYNKERE